MVGENFEFYLPKWSRIAFKLSNIVGEKVEFYFPRRPKLAFNPILGELFRVR